MSRWITAGAAGLVTGIAVAMIFTLPVSLLKTLFVVGALFITLSLLLIHSRHAVRMAAFIGFAVLGSANTVRLQDTTSPGHLAEAVRRLTDDTNITLEGIVFQPPDIRETYTIIPLKVIRLLSADGAPVPVQRGNVYVRLYPTVGEIYPSIGYGDRLEFRSVTLTEPDSAANPGAFDMKTFLNNQGYYAVAAIRHPNQIERKGSGIGNPLIRVAETVKNHLLIIIKKTLPNPESTFLGGVLLGLRSGLSLDIRDSFRAAGVSHVLAVSGLHVTIITMFFMGLFALIKVPRTTAFILILCALVLFTLITGARPSTVRASIMNGVTLLFFYFRGIKLDRSILLGVSVAILYILLQNPLLLTEAAFLFSFSAVLSLALLTRPVLHFCMTTLRGFFRIFLFFEALFLAYTVFFSPNNPLKSPRLLTIGLAIAILGFLADRFLPPFFEFRRLPSWFTTFFAAQIAIQLGMFPLTAFYFKKISIAAPLANFIAIPLIGVIVQLGLFAGILGSIPVVGIYLALCLNAANWVFIRFFLQSAHFFGTRFPFPDIPPPGPGFLTIYYLALLLIVTWPFLQPHLAPRLRYLYRNRFRPEVLVRLVILSILVSFLSGLGIRATLRKTPLLTITLLDPSLYFMGGGNAIHIRTPGGSHFLVDAGPLYDLRRNEPVPIDIGQRVVIPALLKLGARHLHGLVLTSFEFRHIGGAVAIIENPQFHVDTIYHALPTDSAFQSRNTDSLLHVMNDPALLEGNSRRYSELAAIGLLDLYSTAKSRSIPLKTVEAGDIIHQENALDSDNHGFVISVLNPPPERYSGSYSSQSNGVILLIRYGQTGILLNSSAGRDVQAALLENDPPAFQVVQLPANGAEQALNPDFLIGAKATVVSTLPSRWAQRNTAGTREIVKSMGLHYFDATREGALTITSDGMNLHIHGYRSQTTRTLAP
ncbi:MAG: ComEC/Rec2 family competence protein [bacterium]